MKLLCLISAFLHEADLRLTRQLLSARVALIASGARGALLGV